MRRLLSTFILLLWALWFGGVVMLFMAASTIFATFPDRYDLAGQAAAHVFRVFNAYQLALAATLLVGTFVWYLLGPPRSKMGLFVVFGVATVIACLITMYIAPQIAMLQRQGLAHSPEFARMHGGSMIAYLAEALMLLIAGALLAHMRE